MAQEQIKQNPKKKKTAKRVCAICGTVFLFVVLGLLLLNAILSVFVKHYYPTLFGYRFFAIVSDSMEDTIPTGSMIASRAPKSEADVKEGSVITFEVTRGEQITLVTHRVVAVNTDANGQITYTTRGDNVALNDSVHPKYSDVVGVYTGGKCAVLGYVTGFLGSTEGAIALIIICALAVIAYVVVHFINLVNVWRNIAVDALKASGKLLADTHNEDLTTIADVIGIAVKEPVDKIDGARKDKKLRYFMRTGTLPKRPYSDDLDENIPVYDKKSAISLGDEPKSNIRYVTERFEDMRYKYTFTARLIMLEGEKKEWYSALKNELLSYEKIKCATSMKSERFYLGRKTVAKFTVRGKTLCLLLALNADAYIGTKYTVKASNGGKFGLLKITSKRRTGYAKDLIADVMNVCGATKISDYRAHDYYLPDEGIVSLMERDLVKRDLKENDKFFKIEQVDKNDVPDEEIQNSDENKK